MELSSDRKKKVFLVIIALILVLASSFVTFDWTIFAFNEYNLTQPELPYTRFTKVSTAFLIVFLVWMASKNAVFEKDLTRARLTYTIIAIGEIAFLFDIYILAVSIFGIIQILLIWRNGQGLMYYFKSSERRVDLTYSIIVAVAISFIEILLFLLILLPHLLGNPLFPVITVYAILLGLSLWVGWMSIKVKSFPRKNALLIAIGMSFFFVADFLVGLNLSLPFEVTRVITHYLTWVFYAPALLLIGLSHYNIE